MRVLRLTVVAYSVTFLIFASLPAEETSKQTVDVTQTGEKYHRDGCRYLGKSRILKDLKAALAEGYTACSRCRPPRGNSDESATPSRDTPKTESKSSRVSQRCVATTKKGAQCKRKASAGSARCWQHQK